MSTQEKQPASVSPRADAQSRPRRTPVLLAVVSVIAAGSLLYRSSSTLTQQLLPEAYALCSASRDIYTVDSALPRAECIVVRAGRVLDVGNMADIRDRAHSSDQLPLYHVKPGSIVVPGLADAHAHVLLYGFMKQLPLAGSTSVAEIITRIRSYILAHPDILSDKTRWIQGMGWDQTKWEGGEFPTADDLDTDPLLRGRPIALSRVDVHASWVSNTVLQLMGELPNTVDGGKIVRGEDGRPTGIFVDNAMDLIPVPATTHADRAEQFATTVRDALAVGLTSIHDAASSPEDIMFYKGRAEEGTLPLRLYLMGNVNSDAYWGGQIPKLVDHGAHGRLNVRAIKLFTDGALGSWGAALLAPYSDNANTTGIMRGTPQALRKLVKRFWQDGFQVNVHCIGDRANKIVLDIFEELLAPRFTDLWRSGVRKDLRPRIEHAQILQPADLERIGRLGVLASVQPTHETSDMWYAESRLGPERIKGAYAYQTLLRASPHNVLPLGSDFPVEGINPLLGFYAAVSRLSTEETSPHGDAGWYASERLTREQALKGMTLDAAYASFSETELGSLTPGKKADFVVLDTDIMTVPVRRILDAKVTATVIDGELGYGSLS